MRTAVDTNIVSAFWSGEAPAKLVSESLTRARDEGALVISAPVYAELFAYPKMTVQFLERFLRSASVDVDFDLDREVWTEAGKRFARYAKRRGVAQDGQPKRLPVDFALGAHALLCADRLLTLDATRYRRDFPELKLIGL